MSPDHIAQETDAHHAVNERFVAQHRLAHAVDQNVTDDPDGGQNRDVNFGMPEEPEQMLPEQRRSSLVRL